MDEVSIDPEKVKQVITYLNEYLLGLPEYNEIRGQVQQKLMDLYDLQLKSAISVQERDIYNKLLQDADAPEYLFF